MKVEKSTGTVKDVHSPAGQSYYAPPNYADLPDCPICKYGTPLKKDEKFVCIDCGAILEETTLRLHTTK